jgi:hypothetical protein
VPREHLDDSHCLTVRAPPSAVGRGRSCHPLGVTDLLSFTCPRCGTAADDRYYGPCGPCRTALRREVAGEARAVEGAAYEPKMNVTPNAVALKDD